MIKKINELMNQYQWMDFELSNGGMNKVVLHGFLDEGDEDMIRIVFSGVDAIISKTSFTFEGEGDLLEEIIGEEAQTLNINYSVLQGMKIFKIMNTDISGNMYIIAQNVSYEVGENLSI